MMKVAIIGTGISGLGIASILHQQNHEIVVYEKNPSIGGHSRTINTEINGDKVSVDTGFIVYNERNYPLLTKLFNHLKISTHDTYMSFGVSIAKNQQEGWLEYGTQPIRNLVAQRRNLMRPNFIGMLRDILKFNKAATALIDSHSDITLGELLQELQLGKWFTNYYLIAMGSAIWSTPSMKMLDFPASTFIRFFHNHGLISLNNRPQWRSIIGGSTEYVKRLSQPFKEKIKTNCGVTSIVRDQHNQKVTLTDSKGQTDTFDHVILACHADQALSLLQNPSQEESAILGCFRYQKNHMVLHTDLGFMPKRRSCWSSWIYLDNAEQNNKQVSLSYWMNNLQQLNTETPVIVTLNPGFTPKQETILDQTHLTHPIFDQAAINAQKKIPNLQGQQNTWFCGAYQRYGFHEDGLLSAVNIAKKMGVPISWL